MPKKTVEELIADIEQVLEDLFQAVPRAMAGDPDQCQKRCKDALDALAELREKLQAGKNGAARASGGK